MKSLKKLINRIPKKTRDVTRTLFCGISLMCFEFGSFMLAEYWNISGEFLAKLIGMLIAVTIYGTIHCVFYYAGREY